MNNLKDFASIDFEIANVNRSSVCSVGLAIIKDRKIIDTFYSLIKPQTNYYYWKFTKIHRLKNRDTMSAHIFPEVWAEIAPKLQGLPFVVHNATFDESCLKAVHEYYGMSYPEYEFHCTCCEARKFFKTLPENIRPQHASLDCVCEFFDIKLDNHHNAIADATACAQIALAM